MVPREKVMELVEAHKQLEEPTIGAIWINQDASDVCLVEVIPQMNEDDAADEPILFNPGVSFRFPLRLIAGNLASLLRAVARNKDLASAIAAGEVMLDGDEVRSLMQLARSTVAA